MRTVGIIAEYNPFHTGHEYHIQKAKEAAEADFAVVVMSPDFVQRGEPAVFDKYIRAKMALLGGADLVLELPVCYASGSAEYFAEGAAALLDSLGVIDALCFGGESDDLRLFELTADILRKEPEEYLRSLRHLLAQGKTYPQARAAALISYIRQSSVQNTADTASFATPDQIEAFLSTPNNILGIEYCKALQKRSSQITPIPIKRQGSDYHSSSLDQTFCSATALRRLLASSINIEETASGFLQYLPQPCHELFLSSADHTLTSEDFLPYLNQKLLASDSFSAILDITPDLSDRMRSSRFSCIGKSYAEIIACLKSRQFTEARIRRSLLHLILDLRADSVQEFRENGTVFYARALGFRRSASPLLHELKTQTQVPFAVKPAAAERLLSEPAKKMWCQDLYASHLYRCVHAQKYGTTFKTEYERSPILF